MDSSKTEKIQLFSEMIDEIGADFSENKGDFERLAAHLDWVSGEFLPDSNELVHEALKTARNKLKRISSQLDKLKSHITDFLAIGDDFDLPTDLIRRRLPNRNAAPEAFVEQIEDFEKWCFKSIDDHKATQVGRRTEQEGAALLMCIELAHVQVFGKSGPLSRGGYYLSAVKKALFQYGIALEDEGIVDRIEKVRISFSPGLGEISEMSNSQIQEIKEFAGEAIQDADLLGMGDELEIEKCSDEVNTLLKTFSLGKTDKKTS